MSSAGRAARQRQRDGHQRPFRLGGRRADRAAVPFDDLRGDRQPESHPGGRARRLGRAVGALEEMRQRLLRDPDPVIAHLHHRAAIVGRQADLDRSAVRRILDRVGHQVLEDPLQAVDIGLDQHGVVRHRGRDLMVIRHPLEHLDHRREALAHVGQRRLQLQAAALDGARVGEHPDEGRRARRCGVEPRQQPVQVEVRSMCRTAARTAPSRGSRRAACRGRA